MNPLIAKLKKYGNISPEVEQAIEKRVNSQSKKKYSHFLKQGQTISSLFIIEKGLARAYFSNKGKEVNSWFVVEGVIAGSILPLYAQKPSFEAIEFLEDSEIHSISADALEELYRDFPELNLIGRKVAEELCAILEERITSLHVESAEERYHALMATYPNLQQRINLGHIASYLGITQETLSRIRKR
jgi:CRP-like cAMP-binding protein